MLVAGFVYFATQGGVGAGAVKSAAIVALWMPLNLLFPWFVIAALTGGVFALLSLLSENIGRLGLDRYAAILFAVGALVFAFPNLAIKLAL